MTALPRHGRASTSTLPPYDFRLYVAGGAENSLAAIANLRAICQQFLPDRHHVELVDVLREPERALTDGVLMTPMLLKVSPLPMCKVVGSLNQTQKVLQTLDLAVEHT
jgi:circadian clock protein KaiB